MTTVVGGFGVDAAQLAGAEPCGREVRHGPHWHHDLLCRGLGSAGLCVDGTLLRFQCPQCAEDAR